MENYKDVYQKRIKHIGNSHITVQKTDKNIMTNSNKLKKNAENNTNLINENIKVCSDDSPVIYVSTSSNFSNSSNKKLHSATCNKNNLTITTNKNHSMMYRYSLTTKRSQIINIWLRAIIPKLSLHSGVL